MIFLLDVLVNRIAKEKQSQIGKLSIFFLTSSAPTHLKIHGFCSGCLRDGFKLIHAKNKNPVEVFQDFRANPIIQPRSPFEGRVDFCTGFLFLL